MLAQSARFMRASICHRGIDADHAILGSEIRVHASRADIVTRSSTAGRSRSCLDAGRRGRRPRPGRRKAHHRDLLAAVARRAAAAGDQGAEVRHRQRPRHHLRGAHARRLCHAVQLRRVQDRRQRLADHDGPRRRARRQGEVSVQPVRLLGHDRHLARQREDAEGSRRQGARRRALHHELPDVGILREAGRASTSPRSRS